jgi:hypothetical protein
VYEPTVAPGVRHLLPTLLSNGQTFYGHTITTGPVTLIQSERFNNQSLLFLPLVSDGEPIGAASGRQAPFIVNVGTMMDR